MTQSQARIGVSHAARWVCALCATILLLLVESPRASAPAPQGGGGFQAGVRVVNHAPTQRREWALATVPFPPGTWTTGKHFGVPGEPSEVVPFGARWPDGSVRFGRLAVRVDLQPFEERVYQVREVTSGPAPFRLSPWVQSRLASFDTTLAVSVPGLGIRAATLRPVATVEDTPVRQTIYFSDRIPDTQLIYDLWITFFADQDSARFDLRLTSSIVGSPDWEQPIDWAVLAPLGAYPIVHGATRMGLVQPGFDFAGSNPIGLLGPTSFFDGQAYEWFGELVFIDGNLPQPDQIRRIDSLVALLYGPLYGVATNWPESGAFGPFGHLPDPPPWITDGGRAAAIESRSEFLQWYTVEGERWEDRPLALHPYTGVTGSQHDFGVGKFVDVFVSALPHRLQEIRYMAGEEAHRPVHNRELDGRPLRAVDHPDWVARSGRSHWSSSVSPDRLGKPSGGPSVRSAAHGWFGKDHQHWSSLVLSSAYLLTGSHSLRMELDNDAELFLASHRIPSLTPGSPANDVGNGRALGRVMLTMAWNVLLIDRADVAERMRKRVEECVIPQHHGLLHGGEVLPIDITAPDPRTIGSGPYWSPWQEAQAVLGLAATARVVGSPHADLMAAVIARNLVLHGWRIDFENTLVGYAARYMPGGAAIPPSYMTDPEYYVWPSSPLSFNFWSLPSTKLAVDYARAFGDTATLQRAQLIETFTLMQREWPRTGAAWDSFADWDCVR